MGNQSWFWDSIMCKQQRVQTMVHPPWLWNSWTELKTEYLWLHKMVTLLPQKKKRKKKRNSNITAATELQWQITTILTFIRRGYWKGSSAATTKEVRWSCTEKSLVYVGSKQNVQAYTGWHNGMFYFKNKKANVATLFWEKCQVPNYVFYLYSSSRRHTVSLRIQWGWRYHHVPCFNNLLWECICDKTCCSFFSPRSMLRTDRMRCSEISRKWIIQLSTRAMCFYTKDHSNPEEKARILTLSYHSIC